MPVYIVVASPRGGVGRTTLVAQLSLRLARLGTRCLAVDLDPQNAVSLHLGGPPAAWVGESLAAYDGSAAGAPTPGIVRPESTGSALAEHLRGRRARLAHIPFGTHDAVLRLQAERELLGGGGKLRARLGALVPQRCELLCVDTPAGYNSWVDAALGLADLVLVPIVAEPSCMAQVPAYERYLSAHAPRVYPGRVLYVVNQWNPARQLSCDSFEVLVHSLPDRVYARPVFEDEMFREQLARGGTATLEAPSQAAADLDELAQFVREIVGAKGSQAVRVHAP